MPRPKDLPCAGCGTLMARTSKSLPEGRARCHPCRRSAWGLGPDEHVNDAKANGRIWASVRPVILACARCDSPIPAPSRARRYCTEACFRKARNARGSGSAKTRARGYGTEHQALRARLLPLAIGTACPLCGDVMGEGDELHLDHTEDRSGYRGIVHAACNVADGARRGGQAVRQKKLAEGWRHGSPAGARRGTAHASA